MTVYCPHCGSASIWPQDDPVKIDVEVHQVLYRQLEKCQMCKHVWVDKWWEVWTPEGIEIVEIKDEPS